MSSGAMNHPLLQLFITRFREFIRTPEAVFWSYVFPLVMMLSLGLAFRSDSVEPVSVCVEAGAAGDPAVQTLQSNPRFLVFRGNPEQCRQMLRSGKAELVLTVEGSGSEPLYHYQLDQTRPGSVGARDAVNDALQRAAGRVDRVGTRDSAVTEAGSRYIDFLIPGLIGMGLMGGELGMRSWTCEFDRC
jgi:ABC-2 type transport system permease protein